MEFHEVTKKAVIKALKEPRDFDLNLVKAQIVRRIADRWVGFEFSQLLQKNFGKQMIFKRFIASQMKPVKSKYREILIKALDKQQKMNLRTEIIEDGWNKILKIDTYPEVEGIFNVENTKQIKQQPKVYLYTYSELVAKMKEKGIGRPSTYASIVEKLLDRKYIFESKGFLIPTELGKTVYFYLNQKEEIKSFLSEEFTEQLESFMDKVEEGIVDYERLLHDLYKKILKTRKH